MYERERNRETERERYVYIYLLFVFLSWHSSTCVFSCRWLLLVLYSFFHEPEFSFYIQCIKKNSLQHFIDQLHLCFSVIVIQKHYRIRVWNITFWFCNSLDLVVVMICSLNNPVSKFITPTILCISPNTENRYSVGGTISSTTSVKNVYVVIKTKTFPQFL